MSNVPFWHGNHAHMDVYRSLLEFCCNVNQVLMQNARSIADNFYSYVNFHFNESNSAPDEICMSIISVLPINWYYKLHIFFSSKKKYYYHRNQFNNPTNIL